MKVSTFSKAGLSLATAATLALGLGVTAANATGTPLTATQEDPTASTNLGGAGVGQYSLVGVGSDTIQDVEYGISQDLGTYTGPDGSTQFLNLASWTATGTTGLTYRSGGVAAAHPNGSGAGYTALSESIGRIASGTDNVGIGDVDYSRASGFQGTESTGEPTGYVTTAGTGVVTEIPFAVDAISFAAPAGSPFLKTNSGAGLTLADLANIYSGTVNEVNTTSGALQAETVSGTVDAGFEPIQAFLPKPKSGSRQFFLQQLSKIPSSPITYNSNKDDDLFTASYPANTGPGSQVVPYVGAQMPDGTTPVQEHDAAVLGAVPAGVAAIAPFSAAKFIGYHNGVIADPSGMTAGTGYVLVPFKSGSGAVLPYTGDASTTATLAPNAAYKAQGSEGNAKVWREVFNIIPTAAVRNPNASVKFRALYDTFVGQGSKFCLDSKTIEAYGFLADANCGNTARTADAPSASTPTVTNTAAVAGKSTTVTVSVQSIGNGGGSVTITVNGTAYTGAIPAGQTSVKFTVPTPHAGSISYGNGTSDGFTPNLAGVAPSPITPGTITVAKTSATVKATAARVSHTKIGSATVTVTASGVTVSGTVRVQVKTTRGVLKLTSASKTLSGGKAVVSFGKTLPAGTYYVWVTYSGNSDINSKAYTRLATLTVY
jgi:hypothetical protein